MADIPTIVLSGSASLGLMGVLWKLLNDRVDAKQERAVCEEKHKAVDGMSRTVQSIDTKLDRAIVAIVRLESKIGSNPKGESQ